MTPSENTNYGTRNERIGKALTNHSSKSKAVIALDDSGNVVFQFPSAMEAERNGFNNVAISNCCRGKYKTHRGYRWRFKEDIEENA